MRSTSASYYAVAESLPSFSLWWDIAIISLLVIPPVFALVYFALPLRTARWLLPAGIGVAVLAAVLQIVGLDVLANFAKLAAVTLLAWWFLGFFETRGVGRGRRADRPLGGRGLGLARADEAHRHAPAGAVHDLLVRVPGPR